MKKNLVVLQEGNKDCGSASLLSVIRYYGGDISLDRLIEMTKTTKEGTNFYNMSLAASHFRLMTKCYKVDNIEKINKVDVPFIVQINSENYNHFVVVYKVNKNNIVVMDPSVGKKTIDIFDFSSVWTGYIMLFEKIGNIPNYKCEKVLLGIIKDTLIRNIGSVIFIIILSIIFTIVSCFGGLYSEIVFDKFFNTDFNNLVVITIFFSILFFIKNITNFIRNHLVIYLNQKLDISVIISTYSKIILLPYSYYKNKTTSEVLSRINDLSYVKNFVSKFIVTIFLNLFTFIVSFLMIYFISKKILLVLLIIGLIYIVIFVCFNILVRKNTVLMQEGTSNVNNIIIESTSGYETIKGLNIEDNMIFKFSKLYSKVLNNLYYNDKINNIILMLKEFVGDIGFLLVNFFTLWMIMDNKLSIGNYMTIAYVSGYFLSPISGMVDMMNEYYYVKSAIKRGNNLLIYDDEKVYDENKLFVNGNIKFKGLSYTYNNKNYVLKDINLFIRDKERVLILGESGSGKSTIMKILYKYYDVGRNMVFINDYDLCDYSLSDIRKNVTYTSQSEILFTGSIRDNITLGRDVGEVEFLNICKLLYIDEIVENKVMGYDYILEEGGVNLSGGQRQRIILARSLLKDSKVVVIDEGFNQIDVKLEKNILINIFNYFYDKTFIIISHRNDNMDLYNKIVKIGKGYVNEIEERY